MRGAALWEDGVGLPVLGGWAWHDDFMGGNVVGSGVAGRVAVWEGSDEVGAGANLTYDGLILQSLRFLAESTVTAVTGAPVRAINTDGGSSQRNAILSEWPNQSAGHTAFWLRCNDADGYAGGMRGDGSGGMNFEDASDALLKDDPQPVTGLLDRALALEIRDRRMKRSGKRRICPTAQGVHAVFPSAAPRDPAECEARNRAARVCIDTCCVLDRAGRVQTDEEGRPLLREHRQRIEGDEALPPPHPHAIGARTVRPITPEDPEWEMLGVDYGRLSVLALGAIQELAAKVAALEAEVARLRGDP